LIIEPESPITKKDTLYSVRFLALVRSMTALCRACPRGRARFARPAPDEGWTL